MHPGHVFTLANCSMKKLLLAVASVVFSVGGLLGSAPASAEIVTITGVWNEESNQFDLSNTGAMLQASLGRDEYGRYRLQVKVDPNQVKEHPKIKDKSLYFVSYQYYPEGPDPSGTNWPGYFRYSNKLSGPYVDEKNYSVKEGHFFNIDPVRVSSREIRYFTQLNGEEVFREEKMYLNYLAHYSDLATVGYTLQEYAEDGTMIKAVSQDYPPGIDEVRYWVVKVFEEIADFDWYGIFDFQKSSITFADGDTWSLSTIFSDLFEQSDFNSNTIAFDFINGTTIDICWGQNVARGGVDYNREITGITLAYNLDAIPEPETWAMLLAGLGIVGAVTRRQRIKAAM